MVKYVNDGDMKFKLYNKNTGTWVQSFKSDNGDLKSVAFTEDPDKASNLVMDNHAKSLIKFFGFQAIYLREGYTYYSDELRRFLTGVTKNESGLHYWFYPNRDPLVVMDKDLIKDLDAYTGLTKVRYEGEY